MFYSNIESEWPSGFVWVRALALVVIADFNHHVALVLNVRIWSPDLARSKEHVLISRERNLKHPGPMSIGGVMCILSQKTAQ